MSRRMVFMVMGLLIGTVMMGCSNHKGANNGSVSGSSSVDKETEKTAERIYKESEKLAGSYQEIYNKAREEESLESLEVRENIIKALGDQGYSVVDTDNQIDMLHAEQVEKFVEKAQNKDEGTVTILTVDTEGGFMRYDLITKEGDIKIQRSGLNWKEEKPVGENYDLFPSPTWKYTDKGYLMLEHYQPEVYDGSPGQIAIRVKPMDSICRELNQKYVLPLGYYSNNMLISNWNESNVSELDFYDLYETMYQMEYGQVVPYAGDYGGMEYQIPKAEFEEPILHYMKLDDAEIENQCMYDGETNEYCYRPRGLYDSQLPYGPYPEVTAYQKQDDGNIKLTVEAVWTRMKTDCAITSELVVRPLESGGFQYVSNKVTQVGEDINMGLVYGPRLTDEEWKQEYQ